MFRSIGDGICGCRQVSLRLCCCIGDRSKHNSPISHRHRMPGGTPASSNRCEQQIGAGVGNINDAGIHRPSSWRAIPARAIRRGRQLFQRKFTDCAGLRARARRTASATSKPFPAIGAGLIESCAGCHGRPRGSAGFGGDVVTRPDSRDAPHLFGLGLQEMLADEITGELRDQRQNAINEAREQATRRSRARCRARASTTVPSARNAEWLRGHQRRARREHGPARTAILRAGRHHFDPRIRGRRVQRRDGTAGGGSADRGRAPPASAW